MNLKSANKQFINSKDYIVRLWNDNLTQYIIYTLQSNKDRFRDEKQLDVDDENFIQHLQKNCKPIQYFFQDTFDYLKIFVDEKDIKGLNSSSVQYLIGNLTTKSKTSQQIVIPVDVPIQCFIDKDNQLKIVISNFQLVKTLQNTYVIRSNQSLSNPEYSNL